jgi:hypothetical protein
LTQQEIRKCVIRGAINDFLEEINRFEQWRNLFGKAKPDSRLRDIEMILRFFALYENIEDYTKPMKDFISSYMKKNKDLNKKEQQKLSSIFFNTMDLIYKEIGSKAFKLKAGINIAIFDSISVAIARLGAKKIKKIKTRYNTLMENGAYLEAISKSTTDKDRVESRFKIAKEIFSK